MVALGVGGVEDHFHILLSLPSTMAPAKAMQLIKGGSSKWIHETFPKFRSFEWQEGHGAFSISFTGIESTLKYINSQKEHHKVTDFKTEFLVFLKKHKIEYDERYIWK